MSEANLLLDYTNCVLCKGLKIYSRNMLTRSSYKIFDPMRYTGIINVVHVAAQRLHAYSMTIFDDHKRNNNQIWNNQNFHTFAPYQVFWSINLV